MAGAVERVVLASPLAAAGGRVIASPFQFYCDGADHLRIEGWNSVTGVTVTVAGRWFSEAGQIDTFAHPLTLTADRARTRSDVALTKGYLVNLVVYVSSGAPRIGQTFVKISLIRGLGAATVLLGTLLAGYVTAEQALGWPGSPIDDSISGGGVLRLLSGTNPAAGAEIAETVPTGARWEFLELRAQLVTDATVTNRTPRLTWDDAVTGYGIGVDPTVVAASESPSVYWQVGATFAAALTPGEHQAFLPPGLLLLAGHRVRTATINLQAGDNWSAPTYRVREWLEVA